MRVLYITHYTAMMGANQSLLKLVCELRDRYGVSPLVLVPTSKHEDYDIRDELQKVGIKYIETRMRKAKDSSILHCVSNYIKNIHISHKIQDQLKDEKFDLIHTNSSLIDCGCRLAKSRNIPHIWHLREFGDLDYNMRTPFGKWFQYIIYGYSKNHFIAISNAIKRHYERYTSSPDSIDVIYNGIDAERFYSSTDKFTNDVISICIVGLIHPKKGQIEAIKAARELKECGIENFRLYIVGIGDEDYTREIRQYIDLHNLTDNVILCGLIKDIPSFLKNMDIGLMTSQNEAFGRTTIEYMMSGLLVVASDSGANPEIITHKSTGLLYNHMTYGDLTNKLCYCFHRKDRISAIAHDGQNMALDKFSAKNNCDFIYQLYRKILSDKALH